MTLTGCDFDCVYAFVVYKRLSLQSWTLNSILFHLWYTVICCVLDFLPPSKQQEISENEEKITVYTGMIEEYLEKGAEPNYNLELVKNQTGVPLDICLISLLYNGGDIVNATMCVDNILSGNMKSKEFRQICKEVLE